MQGEEFIVAIVAIVMGASVLKSWIKRNSDKSGGLNVNELMSDLGLDDLDGFKKYRKKISHLEERVQVLEKLATDKTHTLADEIDRL